MALLRGSTWQPLGVETQPKMAAHDVWCLHTMVGSLDGTRAMFKKNGYGGTESHTGLGFDGEVDQWQDFRYTADANLDGNSYVISTETADYGPGFPAWNTNDGSAVPAWTDAQIQALVEIGVQICLPGTSPKSVHRDCPRDWTCYRKGIPPRLIPDTKRANRGIAYHAQGVPGNGLVPGGVQWSSARGKVCPGARRIKQLKEIVIPAVAARVANGGDDDVFTDADKTWIANLVKAEVAKVAPAVWRTQLVNGHDKSSASAAAYVVYGNEAAHAANNGLAGVAQQAADEVRAAIAAGTVKVDISVNGEKA